MSTTMRIFLKKEREKGELQHFLNLTTDKIDFSYLLRYDVD